MRARFVGKIIGGDIPDKDRDLLIEWVSAGWLEVSDASRKSRAYCLSAIYRIYSWGASLGLPR